MKLTVCPGCTLSAVEKPWMSPYALGEYHWLIGVPGCEFSQTIGFEPEPQGSVACATIAGPASAASTPRITAGIRILFLALARRYFSKNTDNSLACIAHPGPRKDEWKVLATHIQC